MLSVRLRLSLPIQFRTMRYLRASLSAFQTAQNGGIIAIVIALCEWVVGFFYRAITDKLGKNR